MIFNAENKGREWAPRKWACWMLFAWLLGVSIGAPAASTSFSFAIDEPCRTSAGVFTPDGTLIRTLWSKVAYAAGNNSATWDGLDDNHNAAPPGVYQIKLLQHNTEYVWDGAIGNTSAEVSGPTVHSGFYPMKDMTISGTNAFYVTGYNEGKYDFCAFYTTDPQRVVKKWGPDGQPANVYDRSWHCTATDGSRVYFACSTATNPKNTLTNNYPGFILASDVASAGNTAYFAAGVPIVNGMNTNSTFPNGIYVGTQPGLSGLAVQQNGNLLAVSVGPDNRVYLLDKVSGVALNNFNVSAPGRLSFSPDGSLWVISGNNVIRYTNLGGTPSATTTILNFSEPLAVAVNPANPNLILVADGGASQQVKAFDSAGTPLWTYGLAGGYQANGVAVATNKFWFYDGENDETFLCFAPDGSFWVGDGGNHRSLHFSPSLNYIDQIMFQPHSYVACVDRNNPSRVFNQFLEFNVDYTKPLSQGWTLVNNWRANVPQVNISWDDGIREVTTFPNGRTYALVDNNSVNPVVPELCELGANFLRLTGIFPLEHLGWLSFGPDGSARITSIGVATWYQATLKGFDANNNPLWNNATLIASASNGATDPVPRCCSFGNIRTIITSGNVLLSFDQSLNNGWHLGGIRLGDNKWLWKASPAGNLNGAGNYEIANGVIYGGSTLDAVDHQVIYGYHGEFYHSAGEASQTMHFYDDGLFVGQFGEAGNGHQIYEGALPAFEGNGHSPSLMKSTNGDYYFWVNDESDHGPQRWHFVNARNIREQTGSGTLGSTITLASQNYGFPAGVTGKNGNQSGELSWKPVSGATSYNIRYSLINGGPYGTLAGTTTNLNYVAGGLTNGQTYYFAVTAVQGGAEGIPSEQVKINPFDTGQTVLCTGSMSEGGQYAPVIEVSSAAPAAGQPGFLGSEHVTGVLSLRELDAYGYGNLQNESLGTKGYVIYQWGGSGTTLANVLAPFTVANWAGFVESTDMQRQYRVDNVLGVNRGLSAAPIGTIKIGVTDTNYHYLTVISPAQFNNSRKFTMGIISTNGTSAQFSINESPGLSHVFQFLFRGNITLSANGTGGSGAIVQALFLDDAPVTFSPPSGQSPGPSTTTLTPSTDPAPAGTTVTFTATVSVSGGMPTGTVTFMDGNNNLGAGSLNGSGAATLSTTALSAGSHAITAVYGGDSAFGGSTSSVLSQTITNAGAAGDITSGLVVEYPLAANGNDTQSGNNLTLAGSPTFSSGAVNWNGTALGYSAPQQWPQSGLTVTAWINPANPAAACGIADCFGNINGTTKAAYLQFYTYNGGLLARVIQTADVNFIGRTTPAVLTIGPHFVVFTWNGGTTSGAIKIYLDGVQIDNADNKGGTFSGAYAGSDLPLSVGAQLSTGSGLGGQFTGSEREVRLYNRALSGSEISTLYALQGNGVSGVIASTTTVRASANPAVRGGAVTFTGTVSGSGGLPTGTVAFLDGSTTLGVGTLNGAGTATLGTSTLAAGSHTITAVYSGNSTYGGSASSVLSESIVNTSATILTGPTNPVLAGSTVTFAVTVSGSGGTPAGTVSFLDGSASLGTAPLNGAGVATLSTSALSAGSHAITAVYGGNATFAGSTSGVLSENIVNDITSGLVVDYPLAANGNDARSGNNLTLAGSPVFNSGAVNWNGAVPTLGYSAPQQWPQSGLTVTAWINPANPAAAYGIADCFGNINGTTKAAYLQFYTYNGGLLARVIQTADANYIGRTTPAALTSGQHFVAFTWNGGTTSGAIKIYLDGVQIDNADNKNGSFTGAYAGSDLPLSVGAQLSTGLGFGGQFTGCERGVRLYNRALSGSEISTLYTLQASTGSGMMASTTMLAGSQSPALAGSMVTFTATVSVSGGMPTGTVTFMDGNNNLGAGSLNGSGAATLSTTALSAGSHAITAVYGGDSAFGGSTSSVLSQTITNAGAAGDITSGLVVEYPLAANGNDTQSGNNLTLAGSPTFSSGAVNWNGTALGYSAPQQWPQSGLTVTAWINPANPAAACGIADCFGNINGTTKAAYLQFYTYNGGLLARVIQTADVNFIGRTTPAVLTIGPHFVVFTWNGGTTSGAIKIYLDGVQIDNADNKGGTFSGAYAGSDLPLSVGAQLSTGSGLGGQFTGSEREVRLYNRALSGSEISTLYALQGNGVSGVIASTTTVRASANPAVRGGAVTFTGTVSGSGGLPTGTVAFLDGSTTLGVGTLNGAGTATLGTSTLAAGSHTITAVYSGNSTYGGSASSVLSESIVNTSATILTGPTNPVLAGSTVTFAVTVSGSGGTPAGTVSFLDGSASLGTAPLNGAGVATLSTSALSAGSHAITAVYGGNATFAGSTSGVLSENIVNDITSGLVVDYPLAANGNDARSGNNLTLAGSPVFNSGAVNWNGAVPTLGYSAPQQWPQSGLTVTAWINPANPAAAYGIADCFGNINGTTKAAYLQFYTYNGGLLARVIQTADANYIGRTTPAALTSGQHFVAFTWNGGTTSGAIKIYLDGVQIDNADNKNGSFTGAYAGSDLPLSVGAQLSTGLGFGGQFTGCERGVRLYNRALSGSEISTLYTLQASTGSGMMASTTMLAGSQSPALAGSMVTFTATVSGIGGVPAGTVTFLDGNNNLGTGALNGAGVAVLSTSAFAAGSHAITAIYNGNSTYGGSTSGVLTESIVNDITNGLVVGYPLAANGNDIRNGNNLTLIGSPTFSSGAVNWSGSVPTLGCSAPQQWPQSGLTVTAWINPANPAIAAGIVDCFGNFSGTTKAGYLQFYTYNRGLLARVIQTADVNYIGRTTSAALTAGLHLAAFTWNGGTTSGAIKIYLDGVQIDNADNKGGVFTGAYAGNDVPLSVGAQLSTGSGLGGQFTGSEKGVRLYNRALSGSEINTLYTNGISGVVF